MRTKKVKLVGNKSQKPDTGFEIWGNGIRVKKRKSKFVALGLVASLVVSSLVMPMVQAKDKFTLVPVVGHEMIPKTEGTPDFVIDAIDLTNNKLRFHILDTHFNGRTVSNVTIGYKHQRIESLESRSLYGYANLNFNWATILFTQSSGNIMNDALSYKDGRIDWEVDTRISINNNKYYDLLMVVKFSDNTYWNGYVEYDSCMTDWQEGMECRAESFTEDAYNNVIYKAYAVEKKNEEEKSETTTQENQKSEEPSNNDEQKNGTEKTDGGDEKSENEENNKVVDPVTNNTAGTKNNSENAANPTTNSATNNSVKTTASTTASGDSTSTATVVATTTSKTNSAMSSNLKTILDNTVDGELENTEDAENSEDIEESDEFDGEETEDDADEADSLEVPVLGGDSVCKSNGMTDVIFRIIFFIIGAAIGAISTRFFLSDQKRKDGEKIG